MLAESAAHTFYWKYHEDPPARCKIIDGLVKSLIIGTFMFLAFLVSGSTPAIAGVIPVMEAAGSSVALSISGGEFTNWAFNFAGVAITNVS